MDPGDGAGSAARFKEWYAKYAGLVHARCRRYARNQHEADDLTQEIFLKIWNNMDSFRGDSSPLTWIYSISTNALYDYLRRRRRLDSLLEPLTEQVQNPDDTGISRVILKFRQMLSRMDSQARKIGLLVWVEGLDQGQAAEVMGLSRKTIQRKLAFLKEAFQTHLESDDRRIL